MPHASVVPGGLGPAPKTVVKQALPGLDWLEHDRLLRDRGQERAKEDLLLVALLLECPEVREQEAEMGLAAAHWEAMGGAVLKAGPEAQEDCLAAR